MHDEPASGRGILEIFNRNYLLNFFAFFFCLTAFFMLYPTLPIFLAKSGSSDREIGVIIGMLGVSSLISRFLVGSILTRYSPNLL
jgi:predicted MFS family arabinose efflux permease